MEKIVTSEVTVTFKVTHVEMHQDIRQIVLDSLRSDIVEPLPEEMTDEAVREMVYAFVDVR